MPQHSTPAPARQSAFAALHAAMMTHRLTQLDYRVFTILVEYCTDARGISYVRSAKLAQLVGCNEDTITIVYRRLARAGLVERVQRGYQWHTRIPSAVAEDPIQREQSNRSRDARHHSKPSYNDQDMNKYAASMAAVGGMEGAIRALRC